VTSFYRLWTLTKNRQSHFSVELVAVLYCYSVLAVYCQKGGLSMPSDTRMTVYLRPKIYRALKIKSATTDRSVSEIVNAAVIEALREDKADLEAIDKRNKEPSRPFQQILRDLKRDGLL